MSSSFHLRRPGRPPVSILLAVVLIAAGATAGIALAKSLTLQVAKNATVTNFNTHASKHESIVVSRSFAVYWLSGDSKAHPECVKANGCFKFWPPLTVASAGKLSKAPGIKGKLSTWHRNGFTQVVLGGHPLYFFSFDKQPRHATGESVHSFGGTWHVIAISSSSKSANSPQMPASSGSNSSTSTSSMTSTNPYPYPYP